MAQISILLFAFLRRSCSFGDRGASGSAPSGSKVGQGEKPKLWGPSIVGFGKYHYRYDSGREGDMPLVGFSPRKAALVPYGLLGQGDTKALLLKLGNHTTGKGCLYIKRLADVESTVLERLIKNAITR